MSRAYKARYMASEFLLTKLGGAVDKRYCDAEYNLLDEWTAENYRKVHRFDCKPTPLLSSKQYYTWVGTCAEWCGVIYDALEISGNMNKMAYGRWKVFVEDLFAAPECYSILATMAETADYIVKSVEVKALRSYKVLKRTMCEVAGPSKTLLSQLFGLVKPIIMAWFSDLDTTGFRLLRSIFCFTGRISLRTDATTQKAISTWQDTRSRAPADAMLSQAEALEVNEVIREWFPDTFEFRTYFRNHFCPHHGGGSTFEGVRPKAEKWLLTANLTDKAEFLQKMEYTFKSDQMAVPYYQINGILYNSWEQDCHRGGLVPKSYKTDRFVSLETVTNQFLFEGFGKAVQLFLLGESRDGEPILPCDLRRHYYVRSEHENRNLAARGSKDGKYVTIDLSSASDTVWQNLSKRLFHGSCLEEPFRNLRTSFMKLDYRKIFPDLLLRKKDKGKMIKSSSSRCAEEDFVSVYEQYSYAPMGSACCFPHESIVFAAIVESALRCLAQRRITTQEMCVYWVYGDDIVCHRDVADEVLRRLRLFCMSPNMSKTFVSPPCDKNDYRCFRESCGGEYLNGTDVTPVRISRKFAGFPRKGLSDMYAMYKIPEYGDSSSQISQLYSMANELFEFRTARLVIVEFLLVHFRFPVYFDETGEAGIRSNSPTNRHLSPIWDDDWQIWRAKTFHVKPLPKEWIYTKEYKLANDREFEKRYSTSNVNDYVTGGQRLYESLYSLWMRDGPADSPCQPEIDPYATELVLSPAWVEVSAPRFCDTYPSDACLYAAIAALEMSNG